MFEVAVGIKKKKKREKKAFIKMCYLAQRKKLYEVYNDI